jgi:hypothetical protein
MNQKSKSGQEKDWTVMKHEEEVNALENIYQSDFSEVEWAKPLATSKDGS